MLLDQLLCFTLIVLWKDLLGIGFRHDDVKFRLQLALRGLRYSLILGTLS
jgi:hypothetical protein